MKTPSDSGNRAAKELSHNASARREFLKSVGMGPAAAGVLYPFNDIEAGA